MDKKDRMLKHITNNVKWFLSTDSSVEVIPYYNLSRDVFFKAKECVASEYVDEDDVVCLVSTSILEPGKSGVLFTTDAVYCKSWGLLTKKYHNYYFEYEYAEFDFHNDFYENRMRELMKDLNDISEEEDEDVVEQFIQQVDNLIDKGKEVGNVVMKGMELVDDIVSLFSNSDISNEIDELEESDDSSIVSAIAIYKEFIPLMYDIVLAGKTKNTADETRYSLIAALHDLLLELYFQALDNVDVSNEDMDEYFKFSQWLEFWSLMFCDSEQFVERYPIEILRDAPECWEDILGLTDDMLEDIWGEKFSDSIYNFAYTVIRNAEELNDALEDCEWMSDEFIEKSEEFMEINNQAVKSLVDILEQTTDLLKEMLPSEE